MFLRFSSSSLQNKIKIFAKFRHGLSTIGGILKIMYNPSIAGFLFSNFCFHIGGEHPNKDVELNGNQSLGLVQKKRKKDLSIICIFTIARNRDMMNLIQNCSFFLFKKKEYCDRVPPFSKKLWQ